MNAKIPLSLVALLGACSHTPSGEGSTTTTSAQVPGGPKASPSLLPDAMVRTDKKLELQGPALASTDGHGTLETVATIGGQMPTGVAVANDGRVFLSFPHWSDPIEFGVAELKDGVLQQYPDEGFNHGLTSVQSVYVDARNFLWVLDTGSVNFGAVAPGAAKLVEIDLMTNKPVLSIEFPPDVVLPRSYLNDVRFDRDRGKEGTAFITDSSPSGSNAIIVVDLATKKSFRRLADHPSVRPDPAFLAFVEGQPVYRDALPGAARKPLSAGVDGIAISPDKKLLYYCPLASRHLYAVSVDALADPATSDAAVAKTVADLGEKGASDGLETDAAGRVYATNVEGNAIERRDADGTVETIVSDARLLWPDSLSVTPDGYVYVTANQLHRQPNFHGGKDERAKPYALFRVKIDGERAR